MYPFFQSVALPFIGEVLAYLYRLQPLVNPVVGITQPFVVCQCLLDAQFGVLYLVEPVGCHLCHPLLERLCFGGWNGLDKAEELFSVSNIRQAHLAIWCLHFQTVTVCHGFIPLSF